MQTANFNLRVQRGWSHRMTMVKLVQDFQEAADMLGLEFSAGALWRTYALQYHLYAAPAIKEKMSLADYVVERMNEVFVTMINYYGPGGGGRYKGSHY